MAAEEQKELKVPSKETEDWRDKHPLLKAARENTGFVCWHTQELRNEDIKEAIEKGRSIEIDISQWGPEMGKFPPNTMIVRHHPWYQAFNKGEVPDYKTALTPNDVLAQVEGKNVFVKFDLKSPEVISWFLANADRIAPELRMGHCFLAELHYSYKQDAGHSASGYLNLADLKKIRGSLNNIPFQVSCQGVSLEDLTTKSGDSYPVIDRLCEPLKELAE